jgi:putative hemolysin
MTGYYPEIAGIVIGSAILFLLSMIEGALIAASPVALRLSLERENGHAPPHLAEAVENKTSLFLPLHLGSQVVLILLAVLFTCMSVPIWGVWGWLYALGFTLACSVSLRQFLPRFLTQNEPERKLIMLLRVLAPLVAVCHALSFPIEWTLRLCTRLFREADAPSDPGGEEATEDEIQAYLEIGENEGILEKEDTQLIQSVVEFGDTLVREVMTPRTRIAACSEEETIGTLRDIMVKSRHSRIPIFRGDIDHIVGIAYIRHLLAQCSQENESEPLSSLVHPALFIPEAKRVSTLLKELQLRGDHMAIVVDEFGGVAGLVTIEDLVEEIVGEIRDEDQAMVSDVIEENPRCYVVRGSTELYHLEEIAGRKFSEQDASTIAGLISSALGRIPGAGEEFDLDGIRVEILDADRKRIRRLRVRFPPPPQKPSSLDSSG